ncbi:MAG TPA: hypothetical protein VJ201_07295, partial [Candidatus Babeliales bacterium]|nr:hypothetical protein [Candidatus Babeliales bacterium]
MKVLRTIIFLSALLYLIPVHTMLKNVGRASQVTRTTEEIVNATRQMPKAQTIAVARASIATAKEKAPLAPKVVHRTFSTGRAAQAATPQASKAAGFAHEVTAWAKANSVKTVTMAGISTTGVTAYLCKEKINELTIEQFNKHTDEIYKKAEENKIVRTLVAHFIARNFMNIDLDKIENFVKKNPDAAKIITQKAIENFSSLITTLNGLYTLGAIAKGSPDAAEILAQEAAKNFSSLISTDGGCFALSIIVNGSPDAAKILAPEAAKNFSSLIAIRYGRDALAAIAKGSPDAAKIITQKAVENFSSLITTFNGLYTIRAIAKGSPNAAKILAQEAAKNFSSLISTDDGCFALSIIANESPDAAKILAPEAAKNFSSLITTASGPYTLGAIAQGSPDAATILTSEAIQHIDSLTQTEEKIAFLSTISKNADKEIKIIISQKLSAIIEKKSKITLKNNIKIRYLYAELSGDDTYTKDLTPSEIFLGKNKNYLTDSADVPDIEAIKTFEKEHKSGYVLAYHGQRFLYLPLSQLFTDLKAAHEGKDRPNDFLHPHIKDFEAEYGTKEQQTALLKKLRTNGRGEGPDTEIERQTLLFLQLVPFDGYGGTYPYSYYKDNNNAAEIKVNVAHVFKSAGYENFYAKYGSELEDIFTKMENCSNRGNLLCIAVPENIAQDQIYPSCSGGPMRKVYVNDEKTDSAPLAYAAYKKGQFQVHGDGSWVMIMLGKALDPESGIKVMPLYDIKKGKEQKYLELVF